MVNKHLIGKQVWELSISSSRNAYAIQQKVSEMVWKELTPELSALFDRIAGKNEVITLDKIELDIGTIDLTKETTTEIINKIVKSLEDQCFRAKTLHQNRKAFYDRKLDNTVHQPLGHYHFESWIYWLKTGTLPSYAIAPNEQWILMVLETLGLEHRAVVRLEETLKKSSIALRRLVLQHKRKDLKSIVELFTGYSQTSLLAFFNEVSMLFKQELSKSNQLSERDLEVALWEMLFGKVILKREKLTSEILISVLVHHPGLWAFSGLFKGKNAAYPKQYPVLFKGYKKARKVVKDKQITRSTKEEYFQDTLKQVLDTKDLQDEMNVKPPKKKNLTKSQDEEHLEANIQPTPELKDISENSEVVSPQFFKNAGVVLLHPFLQHIFQNLKLLKGTKLKNFKCQSKAVLLLHYLATAKEGFGDYEMVLPKFLCGMPANLPMDHTLKLSKKERKEANGLLQAAIDHWVALGTTSPDGLREGFLMREGKLVKEQSGWKLYVEQKAMDVLIDRLPWNLSMIKLPWMKEILKVEWR